jgi:hypothetical protein
MSSFTRPPLSVLTKLLDSTDVEGSGRVAEAVSDPWSPTDRVMSDESDFT